MEQAERIFEEAARYLESVSGLYPLGLRKLGLRKPDTQQGTSVKEEQRLEIKPNLKVAEEKSIASSFFGHGDATLLFVLCGSAKSRDELINTKDGHILQSLIEKGLKVSVDSVAFCVFHELSEQALAELVTSYQFLPTSRMVFFGEEFSEIEHEQGVDFSYIENSDSYGSVYKVPALFAQSLQEIRTSISVKKEFWKRLQDFLA